jgi:hypothetical protein
MTRIWIRFPVLALKTPNPKAHRTKRMMMIVQSIKTPSLSNGLTRTQSDRANPLTVIDHPIAALSPAFQSVNLKDYRIKSIGNDPAFQ